MAEQFTIPTPGDVIAGRYLIKEELGRGSYGVVFRAQQLGVGRDVAFKTLLPQAFLQEDIVHRFQREAALISRLHHPNIVTLYDFGEADGVLYMAMEFVRGRQLNSVIRQEAPLNFERAVRIARQVLEALQAAHSRGIVHRDLKPENIILSDHEQGPDYVKVLDFGIAKMTSDDEQLGALKTLTVQGYVLGTPHYMSPETITGETVDNRADLYAVGMLLHEMLTGVHPYDAPNPSAVLMKHLSEPVPSLPDSEMEQSHVGEAVRWALAKAPEERVGSAEAFIEALDGLRTPPPMQSLPTERVEPRPSRRGLNVVAVMIALTVALLAVAMLTLLILLSNPNTFSEAAGSAPATSSGDASGAKDDDNKPAPKPDVAPALSRAQGEVRAALGSALLEASIQSSARQNSRPSRPSPEATQNTAAQKDRTVLRFTSTPAGAQVIVNGRPVGVTPCQAVVNGQDRVGVTMQKIGFRKQSFSVRPQGGQQNVSARLRPGRIKLSP